MVCHFLGGGNFCHPHLSFEIGDDGFEPNEDDEYTEEMFKENVTRMRGCETMTISKHELFSGELYYDAAIHEFFREVYEAPDLKKIMIRLDNERFVRQLLWDLRMIDYSDDLQVTIATYPGLLDEKAIREMLDSDPNSPFSQERVIIEVATAA